MAGENDKEKAPVDDSGDDDEPTQTEKGPGVTVAMPGGPHLNFSTQPQKIIVIAMVTTGLVSLIEHVAQDGTPVAAGQPGRAGMAEIVVGTFVSTALLLGMSYFLPEFAGGLAVVALATTVLERGKPFWDVVGGAFGAKSTLGAYTLAATGAGTTPAPGSPAAPAGPAGTVPAGNLPSTRGLVGPGPG